MEKVELKSTEIPAEEAKEILLDDAVALLSNDIHDPLARAIEEALQKIDAALAALEPR